jgi:hypothetical protein
MNQPHFAFRIRRALDASAAQLPYRVTHRLARAREAALAAIPPADAAPGRARFGVRATNGVSGSDARRRSAWLTAAGAAAPLVAVVIGLYAIVVWQSEQQAWETAEVDVALLTDDLPLDAYADRGFGVFIRNTRQ